LILDGLNFLNSNKTIKSIDSFITV